MLQTPRNRKGIRKLLEIVNYYRKFMPNMAATAKPIYALLKIRRSGNTKTEDNYLRKLKKRFQGGKH